MPHVIEPFTNSSFEDAVADLRAANSFIVSRAKKALIAADISVGKWGISLKRTPVDLGGDSKPRLVGKQSERLSEVINIAATVERLIAAIEWFKGNVVVRCEVCDVASNSAGSNGKEKKDIRNLGCNVAVPEDNVRRYICTSPEFASALTSEKRKWATMPYRYEQTFVGDDADCRLLLICPNGK